MKLVLATLNTHKKIEIKKIFSTNKIELLDCNDLQITKLPEETGNTYEENAYIKAKYVFEQTKLPTCSDDSGIEIEFFDFKPGVQSARFLSNLSYFEKNSYIIEQMKNTTQRFAQYICSVVFINQDFKKTITEKCTGKIAEKIRGTKGFGFDPIFIPDGYNFTFGELSLDIKNQISHRAKAFKILEDFLIQKYNL
ncbi:MAG TPA: RdgB/HAM1 family non-canonical purine NTP pyrophosphatase [bacterium]|nr:RdgB/HAM1 family non-canonical purine NTP pyrophosphatase [bacterium]HOL46934.1 RdgB/HAM1 family non-canonical purine NTP pyrophosphatase [bacterium]HPQ18200.1 RdgB/HAM1 family non-canonical purine NTP pyrophosphatase [bacterium]